MTPAEAAKPTKSKIMNTTKRPTELAAVPGSVPVLSDEEIADMFDGTNFGSASETANGRRGLMVECILKHNAGYVDGSTIITRILVRRNCHPKRK